MDNANRSNKNNLRANKVQIKTRSSVQKKLPETNRFPSYTIHNAHKHM